jgi:hypothetical protein
MGNHSVAPCTWEHMWFRSQAERRLAEALDEASVLFIPNATARLGVTPDHRANRGAGLPGLCEREVGDHRGRR